MDCRITVFRMLVLVSSVSTLLLVNRCLHKPGNLQQLMQLDGTPYYSTASTGQT